MITIERGDTRILTWQASADPDLIYFAVYSGESVVSTHTAVKSAVGQWYSIVPFDAGSYQPGYYNGRWVSWASSVYYHRDELIKLQDVTALDVASYYANAEDLRDSWASLNAAGAKVTNPTLDDALRKAHTVIDGFMVKAYALPFDGNPPLLRTLCNDLALYRIAARQVPRDERGNLPAWVMDLKEEALAMLASVTSGTADLVTASGTVWPRAETGGQGFSHTREGYAPIFTHLEPTDQRVDPDLLDDETDEVW